MPAARWDRPPPPGHCRAHRTGDRRLLIAEPENPPLCSSWHSSVATLPAEHRAATPFQSREWAAGTALLADTPVRADQIAGQLLLIADEHRAIDQNHRVIRSAEHLGLYGQPTRPRRP
ncbi:hypothetical protein [Streptomyces sp. A5-4]|uniref:hypothetical protein n=1 Tax=Streptomyces sp. A5-4 TaxID=3384771 RepID=UPI003DA9E43B